GPRLATTPAPKRKGTGREAVGAGEGLWRWARPGVPGSSRMPGPRTRRAPPDYYAYGAHRGGIDERWFASTTPAANEGRVPDEGLSWVVHGDKKAFTLLDAVTQEGPRLIGRALWDRFGRWPVYSKFFDSLGPIPHHI